MNQLTKYLPQSIKLNSRLRYPVARLMTMIVIFGVMAVAHPALAQDGIGGSLESIITSITDLIQQLTLGVGVLGVVLWGFGKVARPIFPEIAQLTAQYFNQFIIGVVAVFAAAEIVDMVAGAVGGA
jgi:type IV secretory pathway VirB2 component (pilin)